MWNVEWRMKNREERKEIRITEISVRDGPVFGLWRGNAKLKMKNARKGMAKSRCGNGGKMREKDFVLTYNKYRDVWPVSARFSMISPLF